MTKKTLNQNSIYVRELVDNIETGFIFSDKPINRFGFTKKKEHITNNEDKVQQLLDLKKQINSIENCNIKKIQKN